MSDPTVIAAAIVTVLTALGVLVVTIINAKSAADERHDARVSRIKVEATTVNTNAKADTIIEKASEIHTLTNSNLSKVTEALEVANEKIEGLQKLVGQMMDAKGVADRLADRSADRRNDSRPTDSAQSLSSIDDHTAAIEKNTAKTDATIQDLKKTSS
jgi:hypothetical protein